MANIVKTLESDVAKGARAVGKKITGAENNVKNFVKSGVSNLKAVGKSLNAYNPFNPNNASSVSPHTKALDSQYKAQQMKAMQQRAQK